MTNTYVFNSKKYKTADDMAKTVNTLLRSTMQDDEYEVIIQYGKASIDVKSELSCCYAGFGDVVIISINNDSTIQFSPNTDILTVEINRGTGKLNGKKLYKITITFNQREQNI